MKSALRVMCAFWVVMLLTSCNAEEKASCKSLLGNLPPEEVNTELKINAPPSFNSFRLGDDINLFADNYSHFPIEISPDKDLKVYWLQGNSWTETKNLVDYLSAVDRISVKSDSDPGGTTYSVTIDLSKRQGAVRTCIILYGIKDPDRNRVKLASYIELTLQP